MQTMRNVLLCPSFDNRFASSKVFRYSKFFMFTFLSAKREACGSGFLDKMKKYQMSSINSSHCLPPLLYFFYSAFHDFVNLTKNAPNSQRGKHGKAGKIQERVPAGDRPLDERSWTIDQTSNEGISPSFEVRLLTVDGEFLIASVNSILSSQGTLTTLTLSPKAAYELIPLAQTRRKILGCIQN